jgi:hypothetical protein
MGREQVDVLVNPERLPHPRYLQHGSQVDTGFTRGWVRSEHETRPNWATLIPSSRHWSVFRKQPDGPTPPPSRSNSFSSRPWIKAPAGTPNLPPTATGADN